MDESGEESGVSDFVDSDYDASLEGALDGDLDGDFASMDSAVLRNIKIMDSEVLAITVWCYSLADQLNSPIFEAVEMQVRDFYR